MCAEVDDLILDDNSNIEDIRETQIIAELAAKYYDATKIKNYIHPYPDHLCGYHCVGLLNCITKMGLLPLSVRRNGKKLLFLDPPINGYMFCDHCEKIVAGDDCCPCGLSSGCHYPRRN